MMFPSKPNYDFRLAETFATILVFQNLMPMSPPAFRYSPLQSALRPHRRINRIPDLLRRRRRRISQTPMPAPAGSPEGINRQTGIYIYNIIQYLCISLPSSKTSFSNTPPLLTIDFTEPMLSLSQTNKTLSIPSFLHSSKAKLIILVA